MISFYVLEKCPMCFCLHSLRLPNYTLEPLTMSKYFVCKYSQQSCQKRKKSYLRRSNSRIKTLFRQRESPLYKNKAGTIGCRLHIDISQNGIARQKLRCNQKHHLSFSCHSFLLSAILRYSDGVMPVIFLKTVKKALRDLKPTLTAMASMV